MSIEIDFSYAIDGFYDTVNYYRSEDTMNPTSMPPPIASGIHGNNFIDSTAVIGKTYYVRFGTVRDSIEKISDEIILISGDSNYSSVVLVSNMRESIGGQPIIDAKGHIFSGVNANIVEDNQAFDKKALQVINGYVRTEYSPDFSFSGDFTAEVRFKFISHQNYGGILCCAQGGSGPWKGWNIIFNANTNNILVEIDNSLSIISSATLTPNIYYHVALCRSGSSVRVFLDGNLVASGTYAGNIDPSGSVLYIGVEREGNLKTNGHFDEVRITKGVARYLANFTPPKARYPLS
ncbi:LamG domain-containing protein [Acinetobacter sp. NIPH1876]|uniref:LamG domain-containing protein n=1 Tax=Acinetobacter sp. NIPH1876 TaxID=2924041 RepID=UPI001FAD1651|nr:LamG domain-containing protein [Acinetobacter sp. NIPH1876]MCJ0827342.1 LamG domain-containing protein [Acinetobacter sp. NIPH1876]